MKGVSHVIDNAALKACPFCGGKAKWRYIKPQGYVFCVKCGTSTGIYSDTYEEADCKPEAIAAWNRRAEPANEPLTPDELREMEGEPVYIVELCKAPNNRWEILSTTIPVDLDSQDVNLESGDCYPTYTLGKTWFAYRRKPEGSDKEC